ncbi:MAG: hypothetical protein IJZ42_01695 [Lachnospiraceae bacterium]|nr:hypothetical protein [Lachnospiraceae bacterium]
MKEIVYWIGFIGIIVNLIFMIVRFFSKFVDPYHRLADKMPRLWVFLVSTALCMACIAISQTLS